MRKNQKGQAVLIVLLSLSVVLIIVLYIMSRSVTDISLSSKEENSMRAFSAAEAGIERVLVTGSASNDPNFSGGSFDASVSDFGSGVNQVVYPISLRSGEIATFWFFRPGDPTNFNGSQAKICWGDDNTPSNNGLTPAVEVTTFYLDAGVYKVARVTLDPNASRRNTENFFAASSPTSNCTVGGEQFEFFSNVTLPTSSPTLVLQFMTVKPLYNTTISHKVAIDTTGYGLLPSQGKKIDSDGSFGDSNRSIEAYQLHPVAPSVFLNAIFSSSGITK